jgi:hypothetical protein
MHTTRTPNMIGGQNDGDFDDQRVSREATAGPTLPLDMILQRLELFGLSRQTCKFLQGDPDFPRLEFRCQQIAFVKNLAQSCSNIPVSINVLIRGFDYPRSRAQAALVHELDDPGQSGKHIAPDEDREQLILDWIQQNAEQDTAITRREIMDYCATQCKIKSNRRSVNSFVLQHSGDGVRQKVPEKTSSAYKYRGPIKTGLSPHSSGACTKACSVPSKNQTLPRSSEGVNHSRPIRIPRIHSPGLTLIQEIPCD